MNYNQMEHTWCDDIEVPSGRKNMGSVYSGIVNNLIKQYIQSNPQKIQERRSEGNLSMKTLKT